MILLAIALLSAYLLGSIPASFLVAKAASGVDVRQYGSGNVGATNVLRTAGKLPGAIALLCDILKGVIAVTALSGLFLRYSPIVDHESFRILMGLSVICGHIWPVFLKFKGGKGVATSAGVLLILCPAALGAAAAVFFITVMVSKYVSLGSILGSIVLPITAALIGSPIQLVLFTITLCFINCYKHSSNIVRLINGEEAKIGQQVNL
ncbi:MAG: glycerol-3-phosphate 1-O-acyltransferase PlsY [Candidatus Omnitrophota bacterium]